MFEVCKSKKARAGIKVISRSGNGSQTICKLGQGKDVKHIVTIRNRMIYRLDIVCMGSIRSKQNKVAFSSPDPSDTPTQWKATASLIDGEECTFDYVTFIGIAQGDEHVLTIVEASWRENKTEIDSTIVTQSIKVTVL